MKLLQSKLIGWVLVQWVSSTAVTGKRTREKAMLRCDVGTKDITRNDQNDEEEMKMAEGRKTDG